LVRRPEAQAQLAAERRRKPAHLGTNLGTKHGETCRNRCDIVQSARRLTAVDLHF
jgi:hypothetical protein